jgi:gamma-glutamylcyclotransferase (GGCT)/AIG2-like uncharacterized protein YtfP
LDPNRRIPSSQPGVLPGERWCPRVGEQEPRRRYRSRTVPRNNAGSFAQVGLDMPRDTMTFPDSSFLAVYGSLRRRSLAKQGFFVLRNLRFHGHGVLRGLLFIQNGYPGVLEQSGLVRVEVYRVLNATVWEMLDRYEGYQHSLGPRALFYRKEVALLRPEIRASVYFLGREIPRGSRTAKNFYFQP